MRGIYQIRCTIPDSRRVGGYARYIGKSSIDIEHRRYDHFSLLESDAHRSRNGERDKLQNAYNKYGKENFTFELVENLDDCSEEYISEREIYWISYYDSHHNGYNCTDGGEGTSGLVHTEETRQKISERLKGRVPSEKCLDSLMKRNIGNTIWLGKHHTEETRKKISEISKGHHRLSGRVWVHRGSESKMIDPADLDMHLSDGWLRGRGYVHGEDTRELLSSIGSSRIWINNGIVSKMIPSSEIVPDGWVRGRLILKGEGGKFASTK